MEWFKFLQKKVKAQLSFHEIGVDMHSHLVPGIDDGVKTLKESIAIYKKMADLGYRKVITTPHINFDYYPNSKESILRSFEIVKQEIERQNINLSLGVAAEYFVDEHFRELLSKKELMPFDGNRILIEFPFVNEPDHVQHILFDLQSNGYKPVIAHFERYLYWHKNIEMATQLKEWGAELQLNLNSISGHYSKEIKKQAEKFILSTHVDFVSSDCHRIQHVQLMSELINNPLFHKIKECNNLLNETIE